MHQPKITDFPKPPSGHDIEVTVDVIEQDIRRVGRIVNERPSIREYQKYGKYSKTLITDRLGGWADALEKAGYERRESGPSDPEYTDDELLEELVRISEEVGESPSRSQIDKHAPVSKSLYHHRFGSLNRAKELVGLKTVDVGGERPHVGELIDAMIELAVDVGRTPYKKDMEENGPFSAATYQRRFGSWSEAHEIAGLPPRRAGRKLGFGYVERVRDYGSNWKEQRNKAIERDRYRCQSCGDHINELRDEESSGLEVHHIVPIREFDEPEDANFQENLITLCSKCHHKVEGAQPMVDAETLAGR